MHTLEVPEHAAYVHHHGDFSGNVLIEFQVKDPIDNVPPDVDNTSAEGDLVVQSAPWGWALSIPYELMEAIVAKKVRNDRIARLEEAEPQEILA